LGAVLRLINKESGGNPKAINLWDSNAKAGHPSGGLIQTIASTFNAYAGGLRGLGMFNPFANIYAGLRYAISRYGSIGAVDPLRHAGGYAKGTRSATRGFHWVGERGPELRSFHGGERVIPNHQLGNGVNEGGMTVNLTINGAMDPNAVARQVQTMLLRLKRTNGVSLGLA
jgi:SLT domain-containing protein